MSKYHERSLSDDWDAVTIQLSKGKPQPKLLPSTWLLGKIRLWPGVFQHRGRRTADGEGHVQVLAAAVKKSRSRTLDPITVWWDGKNWACIDGHHRLDAYRLAGVKPSEHVPVEVFEGSLPQAMAAAASSNTKNKLPMSRDEKSNAAWRMVVVTSMSKQDTAAAAKISEATVAAMRRVRAQLEARVVGSAEEPWMARYDDHRDLSWGEAKRLVEGRDAADYDWDAANDARVQEWATALTKTFGREGAKYPELLARALDLYDTRLMDQMVEYWSSRADDDDEGGEPMPAVEGGRDF